ncbi:MAG: hypothetical protein QM779_11895 [Propionicimonas sp.]|uniref:hypothetical protein n=1 Tax=Propionicimonas sp. TaxID=1955623 RepID=UPI003D128527
MNWLVTRRPTKPTRVLAVGMAITSTSHGCWKTTPATAASTPEATIAQNSWDVTAASNSTGGVTVTSTSSFVDRSARTVSASVCCSASAWTPRARASR